MAVESNSANLASTILLSVEKGKEKKSTESKARMRTRDPERAPGATKTT